MTFIAMMICLLTAATYAGNITIVTESQSTIVETDTVNVESDTSTATLSCADTQIVSRSGEMAIPSKIIKVLLPPDADLSTVECVVQSADYEKVKGALEVRPVPPKATRINGVETIFWPKGKKIVKGKDDAIYKADAFWPRKGAQIVSTGKLRNFKVVEIAVPLAVCNPARKNLRLLTDAVVRIDFVRTSFARADEIGPPNTLSQERARKTVVNFGQYADEYNVASVRINKSGMSSAGYTILTTSAIQSASTKLADFVSHKQARGFNVQVVTESEWGGGTGTTASQNIRSWLQDNYITDDILYVLLIGDPHPTQGDLAMINTYDSTDFYYSDLTDDRMWEVIVGRIPYYGVPADLDHILQKTMDYENEVDRQWRKNVLLPMVPFDDDTPCYQCGEQVKYDLLEPEGIPSVRIYDETYGLDPAPEYLRSQMYPATCWANNAFGMVVWQTHGWDSSASGIIVNGDVPSLNDAYPSVTFQGSCGNSLTNTSNNLTYNLLKNGGIDTIGATNYSYYFPGETDFVNTTSIGGFVYQFAKRIVEGQSCGEALANLREYLVPGLWENFWVFNVYGDPSVVVMSISDDFTPPTPDPMTFATAPYATSESTIAMEASVATDTESGVQYYFTCTAGGGNDSGWQANTFYEDSGLMSETQYTYTVTAMDTSGNCNLTAPSSALSATTLADMYPPIPDPMTWASAPAPNFSNDSPVENLVLPSNGGLLESFTSEYGSGWVAANLTNGITYEYGWASSENPSSPQEFVFSFENGDSAILNDAVIHGGTAEEQYYSKDVEVWTSADGSSYTLAGSGTLLNQINDSVTIDLGAVGAKKVKLTVTSGYSSEYWELSEFVVNGYFSVPGDPETEITMTATTATDPSGVEYHFTCVSGPGNDSGWQDSETYLDTGLTPGTQYTYTVTTRDKSAAQNSTAESTAESATTTGCSTCGDLNGSGGDVDMVDFALFAACWGENPSVNSSCICANLVEYDDDIIDWLDFSVFAELFLSSSSNYPPNCSAP